MAIVFYPIKSVHPSSLAPSLIILNKPIRGGLIAPLSISLNSTLLDFKLLTPSIPPPLTNAKFHKGLTDLVFGRLSILPKGTISFGKADSGKSRRTYLWNTTPYDQVITIVPTGFTNSSPPVPLGPTLIPLPNLKPFTLPSFHALSLTIKAGKGTVKAKIDLFANSTILATLNIKQKGTSGLFPLKVTSPLNLSLNWSTAILESLDSTEIRVSSLRLPKHTVTFSSYVLPSELVKAWEILEVLDDKPFFLPLPPFAFQTTETLPINSSSIPLPSDYGVPYAGGLKESILSISGPSVNIELTANGIKGNHINLSENTGQEIPSGSLVTPSLKLEMSQEQTFTTYQFGGSNREYAATVLGITKHDADLVSIKKRLSIAHLNNHDVITLPHHLLDGGLEAKLEDRREVIDYNYGARETRLDRPRRRIYQIRYFLNKSWLVNDLIQLLHHWRGGATGFYIIDSFLIDVEHIKNSENTLLIKNTEGLLSDASLKEQTPIVLIANGKVSVSKIAIVTHDSIDTTVKVQGGFSKEMPPSKMAILKLVRLFDDSINIMIKSPRACYFTMNVVEIKK